MQPFFDLAVLAVLLGFGTFQRFPSSWSNGKVQNRVPSNWWAVSNGCPISLVAKHMGIILKSLRSGDQDNGRELWEVSFCKLEKLQPCDWPARFLQPMMGDKLRAAWVSLDVMLRVPCETRTDCCKTHPHF
jgi:hypothetical protein